MELIKATPEDSNKLNQYFKSTFFPGSIDIYVHRQKDFFAPYRLQSDDFSTYYLADKKGNPQAVATLIFKKGWIEGEPQTIGYATDLRISRHREAALYWSQYFLPIIKEEKEKRNCPSIFSVVPQKHRQTYNAFIRPRYNKRQLPRYYLFRKLRIVTLHGLFPFAPKPLNSLVLRSATKEDHPALVSYIAKKKVNKPISFVHSDSDVTKTIQRWKNLNLDDFILALDATGAIVGCTAPWRFTDVQEFYVRAYSPKGRTIQTILNSLSYLGVTHPLPRVGQVLNSVYLTHLLADNSDIFYSLLHHVFKKTSKSEFLIYYDFEGHLITLPPRPFISSSISCGLYCVIPPDEAVPELLKPRPFRAPPDFEAAFL